MTFLRYNNYDHHLFFGIGYNNFQFSGSLCLCLFNEIHIIPYSCSFFAKECFSTSIEHQRHGSPFRRHPDVGVASNYAATKIYVRDAIVWYTFLSNRPCVIRVYYQAIICLLMCGEKSNNQKNEPCRWVPSFHFIHFQVLSFYFPVVAPQPQVSKHLLWHLSRDESEVPDTSSPD
jgi:hypothetical protein